MNKEILKQMGFLQELEAIENGKCPFCGTVVNKNFPDEGYVQEYNISGLCSTCQDGFFTDFPSKEYSTKRRELYITATRAKSGLYFIK